MDTRDVGVRMEEYVAEDEVGGWSEFSYGSVGDSFEVPELGRVTLVDLVTSGEGGGEHTHVVFRVVFADGTDRLFMKTGCYMSHYGNDWDGPVTEVKAVEKVVTQFVTL